MLPLPLFSLFIAIFLNVILAIDYYDHIITGTSSGNDVRLYAGDRVLSVTDNTYVQMQEDGNFVLRDNSGNEIWSTNTGGNSGSRFQLQQDGKLRIKDASNVEIYDSKTDGHTDTAPHSLVVTNSCMYVMDKDNTVFFNKGSGCSAPYPTFNAPPTLPTKTPTPSPSPVPTSNPTLYPTNVPTTNNPTNNPIHQPTRSPTLSPTTLGQTDVTDSLPTITPSQYPTLHPILQPTSPPTLPPTVDPINLRTTYQTTTAIAMVDSNSDGVNSLLTLERVFLIVLCSLLCVMGIAGLFGFMIYKKKVSEELALAGNGADGHPTDISNVAPNAIVENKIVYESSSSDSIYAAVVAVKPTRFTVNKPKKLSENRTIEGEVDEVQQEQYFEEVDIEDMYDDRLKIKEKETRSDDSINNNNKPGNIYGMKQMQNKNVVELQMASKFMD